MFRREKIWDSSRDWLGKKEVQSLESARPSTQMSGFQVFGVVAIAIVTFLMGGLPLVGAFLVIFGLVKWMNNIDDGVKATKKLSDEITRQ